MRKRVVFGPAAVLLAAFKIAPSANPQTGKKTAGKEIALEIFQMETFTDTFGVFYARHRGSEKASMGRLVEIKTA
jgi:hypothetical protein